MMADLKTWDYQGVDSFTGKTTKGRVQAIDEESAFEIINKKDVVPTHVTRISNTQKWLTSDRHSKPSRRDIALFIRGYSTASASNMRTEDALEIAAAGVRSSSLQNIAREISNKYAGGIPLHEAFREYSNVFGPETSAVIEAGEASGQTHLALLALADTKERSGRIRGKIIASLIYPSVIMLAAFGAFIVVLLVVLPKVQDLVGELGMEMPVLTQVLVTFKNILTNQTVPALIVLAIGMLLLFTFLNTDKGRIFKSYVAMNLPLFGSVIRGLNTSMLCELSGVMLSAGVTQVKTMELVALTVRNHVISSELKEIPGRLISGIEFEAACKMSVPVIDPVIPALAQQTAAGINNPGKPWCHYGKAVAEETDRRADALKSSMEPLMVITVGLIIALLAGAVYMPMLQVYDFMNTLQ